MTSSGSSVGRNRTLKSCLIMIAIILEIAHIVNGTYIFKWACTNSKCQRTKYSDNLRELYPTYEVCRLVCDENGSALWPIPKDFEISNKTFFFFNPLTQMSIQTKSSNNDEMYRKMVNIFRSNLYKEKSGEIDCKNEKNQVLITINFISNSQKLNWKTDESYTLTSSVIDNDKLKIEINAPSIFGARHGLETLSQLMTSFPNSDNSKLSCLATLSGVRIEDAPSYAHRGLLIDTSRNYLSIRTIKRHIQAMGASKMNFLHWHITDSHSFPMETPRVPNMMNYGAYSTAKTYKYNEIKNIIKYALYRGVRVILELDAPAHAGFGWQWGAESGLGNLTVCLNYQPWRQACIQPPCGQLNPSNENVYEVLENIYKDMVEVAPWNNGEIFHMGGDELFIPCWNMSEEILKYIGNKPKTTETFLDLWSEFQSKALVKYDKAANGSNSKIILWTSHLTDPDVIENYLDTNRYVIQTWVPNTSDLPNQLIAKGYELIISTKNAWYLDHGFWGTTPYYDWRTVYDNKILQNPNVLGGEVCMWGEYVDDSCVIARTWPRAAAAAERLWSNTDLTNGQVEGRFYRHRERLVNRGIEADAVTPRWCIYNEGEC